MQNKHWVHADNDVYELHFTHFYDDKAILKFAEDKDEDETFVYVSDLLKVEEAYLYADSIEEAKEEFEEKVIEHIEDQIAYYEEILEKFKEE